MFGISIMAYYVSSMPPIWTKFVTFFWAFWRGQAQLFQKHKKIVFRYCGGTKLLLTLKEVWLLHKTTKEN